MLGKGNACSHSFDKEGWYPLGTDQFVCSRCGVSAVRIERALATKKSHLLPDMEACIDKKTKKHDLEDKTKLRDGPVCLFKVRCQCRAHRKSISDEEIASFT